MARFHDVQEDDSGSKNGIQWQNVGPGLGLFALSVAFAFAAGAASVVRALEVAGGIFAATIFLGRFPLRMGLPPRATFVVVWVAVALGWYVFR